MERSFAQSKRYGYDRARWRGICRVKIQEYLTCAIQNIQVLVKYGYRPPSCPAMAARQAYEVMTNTIKPISGMIKGLLTELYSNSIGLCYYGH